MAFKENLTSGESWLRGLYILLFGLLYGLGEFVLWAIVLFQFGSQLLSGRPNSRLLEFNRGLNAYLFQLLRFISYRSEYKPYPFGDWPAAGLNAEAQQGSVDGAPEEEPDEVDSAD